VKKAGEGESDTNDGDEVGDTGRQATPTGGPLDAVARSNVEEVCAVERNITANTGDRVGGHFSARPVDRDLGTVGGAQEVFHVSGQPVPVEILDKVEADRLAGVQDQRGQVHVALDAL